METETISSHIGFDSKYMDINDATLHYYDVGTGKPVVFLHGNPTSSYLWRNIIPGVPGRKIAPDMVGMGKSSKIVSDYNFAVHYSYLEIFLLNLKLQDMVLVIHDWGAALGFHFAMNHPELVSAIVFMEPVLFPVPSLDDLQGDVGEFFKNVRDPQMGHEMIIEQNFFIEKMLPAMTKRELDEETMNHYREPYVKKESRKPLLVWPLEVPIAGQPPATAELLTGIVDDLKQGTLAQLPKLLLHVEPGAMIPPQMAEYCKSIFPNLSTKFIGEGLHFIQEDHPMAISEEISMFLQSLQ